MNKKIVQMEKDHQRVTKWQIFVFLLFLGIANIRAQEKLIMQQWQVKELKFSTNEIPEKPFDQVFGAVFMHEGGKTLKVPGFYNGEQEYLIRVSLLETGKWTYITYSNIFDLANKTGSISVQPKNKTKQHGAVTISPTNKQGFSYEDGTPYFALPFEADWLFALDHDNKKDIPKTKMLVRAIKQNGFNQIIMNVFAYDVSWEKPDFLPGTDFSKPGAFPFLGTNEKPDYSALNIGFFKHLDRVIGHLNEQHIISHLMIYVWNKKVNWPAPGSPADNMYFDYIVKRYQAFPNIIWNISKEALLYGRDDMDYVTDRIRRLRKLDAFGRLVTVHDYNYCKAFPSEVDFISLQNHSPNLYSIMTEAKEMYPTKPVLNIEHGGYEKSLHENYKGTYSDPVVSLDRTYQCIFAGCYANYYWQHAAWNEIIYDPFRMLSTEQQPKWEYFIPLSELFKKFNFNELEPIIMDQSTYSLTDKDSVYLFYMPNGLNRVAGEAHHLIGKNVRWSLMNCLTGELHEQGSKTYKNQWIVYIRPEELKGLPLVGILQIIE